MKASSAFRAGVQCALLVMGLCVASRAPGANIVFYVDPVATGSVPGNARDLAMYQRLTNIGHSVTVILDSAGNAGDLAGKDLVLISSSVGSGDMAAYSINTLRTVDIGLVNIEPALFDELFQAPSNTGPGGQTSVTITAAGQGHPLAAGKSGSVVVTSAAGTFSLGAGTLGADAIVIATADQGGNAPAIFAYEQGSRLMDNATVTPKRRVGFFMNATTGTGLFNSNAFDLFDAAINWTLPSTAPVGFSQHPQNAAVLEARSTTFSCVATGAPPYAFQWYRNGVEIPGATARTYNTGPVALSDNGAQFYVVANNAFSVATSSVAVLTVTRDDVAPMLTSVRPDESFVNLLATFSENVREDTATDINNYQLSGGLTVSSAVLRSDGASVMLRTTRQAEATTYTLTVNGIRDLASGANQIAPNSQMNFTSFVVQPGYLRRDVFASIPGVLVADLVNHPAYPYSPTAVGVVNRFEGPVDVLDNYGQKIAGYVIPAVSGEYKFYMSSDDAGELWLSTDENPANATRIAFEPVWNAARDWTGVTRRNPTSPENQSALIPLVAGTRYYVEALAKEGGGGDNLGVTWQGPGEPPPAIGTQSVLTGGLIAAASPVAVINITQHPQNAEVLQGRPVTFRVAATVIPANHALTFQWQTNGIDVTGATGPAYTVARVTLDESGTTYRCIITTAGAQLSSDAATLTVIPDTFPPTLLSAIRRPDDVTIIATFSEELEIGSAEDTFAYQVLERDNPANFLNINSAVLMNGSNVVITTDAALPGVKYILNVLEGSVADLFNNRITPPSNSAPVIRMIRTVLKQDLNGYTGCQDTELRSNLPASATGLTNPIWLVDQNDGAGGGTAGPVHALLRFDEIAGNGPNQVPPGVVVVDASLVLVSTTSGAETPNRINVHRMLVDWNEATATWNSMVGGISSNDLEASSAVDVFFVPSGPVPFTITANSPGVVETVKGWIQGTIPNYGWAFLSTGTDGYRVDSSENATVENHPALVIDYIVPPSPIEILPPLPPASITLNEGDVLTIGFNVRGSDPAFQWFKNGNPLAGANSAIYTVAIAHPSDNGTYYLHAENDFPSATNSPTVSVTVIPDTTRPILIRANGSPDLQTITLAFSERLDATTANNAANYTVSVAGGGTLNVVSATLTNGTNVVLQTDLRTVGANYTITVNNVTDIAQAPNAIAAPDNQAGLVAQIRLLAFDASWKHDTTGTDLGSSWRVAGYNDSGWPSGLGLFGLETPDIIANFAPYVINTAWSRTNEAGLTNITFYVRTAVSFPYHTTGVSFTLRHIVDDGAVFHVNGAESFRFNMPTGTVAYATFASSAPTEGLIRSQADVAGFTCGDNVLAVEIHQNSLGSSDMLFGAELLATVPEFHPCARLSIRNNSDGTVTISWTGPGTLQESSAIPGGWGDTLNQNNPQTISASTAARFYRVRQ